MAITFSFRLMEMACQDSYPLNSENASPPGTFTLYLSCSEMARPHNAASPTAAIPIVNMLLRIILNTSLRSRNGETTYSDDVEETQVTGLGERGIPSGRARFAEPLGQ